jgi:hypothetical protein
MNRTELASVNAVKNDRVYILNMNLPLGIQGPVGVAYAAKIIQPDLFKDLDPRVINEELLTKWDGSRIRLKIRIFYLIRFRSQHLLWLYLDRQPFPIPKTPQ